MKIKDGIVHFKSEPQYYFKEESSLKNNTVRYLNNVEQQELVNNTPRYICIENTKTGAFFTRSISDITFYRNITIISWYDPRLPEMY